jgi:uncharacterized membrane protein (DUF106 family)
MMFGLPIIAEIALIALGISIIYQIVYEFTTDRKKVTEMKSRMKNIREELKGMKPGSKAYNSKQSKMLDVNMDMMKLTMKPTMFTMIPFLLVFSVLRGAYATTGVLIPVPAFLSWIPLGIGDGLGWLWTYIIFSMVFSMVLRKAMDKLEAKGII